jgi:cytochrome c-type biogenesis protein CcmE
MKRRGRKQRRLLLIGTAGLVLVIAAGLILYALSSRIAFFDSPSDVVADHLAAGTRIRLGGLVAEGTVVKQADGNVRFDVTDGRTSVAVSYQGILPDLFREGQGVVAEGVIGGDMALAADTILAKHDERYMPKEVVDALKKAGRWQEGENAPAGDAVTGPPMSLLPAAATQ